MQVRRRERVGKRRDGFAGERGGGQGTGRRGGGHAVGVAARELEVLLLFLLSRTSRCLLAPLIAPLPPCLREGSCGSSPIFFNKVAAAVACTCLPLPRRSWPWCLCLSRRPRWRPRSPSTTGTAAARSTRASCAPASRCGARGDCWKGNRSTEGHVQMCRLRAFSQVSIKGRFGLGEDKGRQQEHDGTQGACR